jgi:hypothetical protein
MMTHRMIGALAYYETTTVFDDNCRKRFRVKANHKRFVSMKLLSLTKPQIAQRAYEIWQREGEVHGKDQDQWYRAIEELNAAVIFEIISDPEEVSRFGQDIDPGM